MWRKYLFRVEIFQDLSPEHYNNELARALLAKLFFDVTVCSAESETSPHRRSFLWLILEQLGMFNGQTI